MASGATGHNAGLAVAHIEKPASELEHMLGLESTRTIFNQLNEAWEALHTIHDEIGLKDNLLPFSHAVNGFNTLDDFISFLKDILLRIDLNQTDWRYLVSESLRGDFPIELLKLVEFVPHQTLLTALKTIDQSYVAAAMRTTSLKGKRMNSAKFCYKVLDYLKERFPHRFSVYEQTDITKIELFENHSVLEHTQGKVTAQDVILCTNAYMHFSIWDRINEKQIPNYKIRSLRG